MNYYRNTQLLLFATLYGVEPPEEPKNEFDKGQAHLFLIIPFLIGLIILLIRTIKIKNKSSKAFCILWCLIIATIIGILAYYGIALLGVKGSY